MIIPRKIKKYSQNNYIIQLKRPRKQVKMLPNLIKAIETKISLLKLKLKELLKMKIQAKLWKCHKLIQIFNQLIAEDKALSEKRVKLLN